MKYEGYTIEERKKAITEADLSDFINRYKKQMIMDPECLLNNSDELLHTYWNVFGVISDSGSSGWFLGAKKFIEENLEDKDLIIKTFNRLFSVDEPTDEFKEIYKLEKKTPKVLQRTFKRYKEPFSNVSEEEFMLMINAYKHAKYDKEKGLFEIVDALKEEISIDLEDDETIKKQLKKLPNDLRGLRDDLTSDLELKIIKSIGELNDEEINDIITYEKKQVFLKEVIQGANLDDYINFLMEPIKFFTNYENLNKAINFCINNKTSFRRPIPVSKIKAQIGVHYQEYLELELEQTSKGRMVINYSELVVDCVDQINDEELTKEFEEIKGLKDESEQKEKLAAFGEKVFNKLVELKSDSKKYIETFKKNKEPYDQLVNESSESFERFNRFLSILTYIENVLFFKPRVSLINAGTIKKLKNAFEMTDYIINKSLSNAGMIDYYIKRELNLETGCELKEDAEALNQLSKRINDLVSSYAADFNSDLNDLIKINLKTTEAQQVLENAVGEIKQKLIAGQDGALLVGLNNKINELSGGLTNNDAVTEIKNEVMNVIDKISRPIKRDYSMLNALLLQAEPESVNELVSDLLIADLLDQLNNEQDLESDEFKDLIRRKSSLLREAPDEAINELIKLLKRDYINKYCPRLSPKDIAAFLNVVR